MHFSCSAGFAWINTTVRCNFLWTRNEEVLHTDFEHVYLQSHPSLSFKKLHCFQGGTRGTFYRHASDLDPDERWWKPERGGNDLGSELGQWSKIFTFCSWFVLRGQIRTAIAVFISKEWKRRRKACLATGHVIIILPQHRRYFMCCYWELSC